MNFQNKMEFIQTPKIIPCQTQEPRNLVKGEKSQANNDLPVQWHCKLVACSGLLKGITNLGCKSVKDALLCPKRRAPRRPDKMGCCQSFNLDAGYDLHRCAQRFKFVMRVIGVHFRRCVAGKQLPDFLGDALVRHG